ncbi:MAG: CinA family protein [Magnetococcales bacterium]|nr:CinA family protein [Magnetococcales bacterium]
MKCLLVVPRWSELESFMPPSGRPHLDLLLETFGFVELGIRELEKGEPFDPTEVDEEYKLILIQGRNRPGGGRLRRSVLSSLGLSLGLDGDESDRLRVVGARPLYNSEGHPAGFAIKRRGRMVTYFQESIWSLRGELVGALHAMRRDEGQSARRGAGRPGSCWMIEGAGDPLDLSRYMGEEERSQCTVRNLPDGDAALFMPALMGDEFKRRVQNRLGSRMYSTEPRPLEDLVGERLRESGVRVVVSESCTGGLVTARISAMPGCSDYLSSGYVTYSDQAKFRCLEVPPVLLERCGAVSPEVALAMARGALRAAGSDLAISVTGIAGPAGGSDEKPVGTVYLAAVSRDGGALEHHGFYNGDRDRIRFQSSQTALHLLRRMLVDQG